jgi:hypothetical protein
MLFLNKCEKGVTFQAYIQIKKLDESATLNTWQC